MLSGEGNNTATLSTLVTGDVFVISGGQSNNTTPYPITSYISSADGELLAYHTKVYSSGKGSKYIAMYRATKDSPSITTQYFFGGLICELNGVSNIAEPSLTRGEGDNTVTLTNVNQGDYFMMTTGTGNTSNVYWERQYVASVNGELISYDSLANGSSQIMAIYRANIDSPTIVTTYWYPCFVMKIF